MPRSGTRNNACFFAIDRVQPAVVLGVSEGLTHCVDRCIYIFFRKKQNAVSRAHEFPFASFRRAMRAVALLYDKELRAEGMRAAQFTLLLVLTNTGAIAQNQLSRLLVIDDATLSRRLALLARRGFIAAESGSGRADQLWRLTKAGRREFARLRPHWKRAQTRLRKAVGEKDWNALHEILNRLTRVADAG